MAPIKPAAKPKAPPRLHVYVSPSEVAAVKQRAATEGIGTSAYVRRLVKRDLSQPAR